MRDYIIRRLLLMIPTMLLITIIVFLMVRFIPGDVVELMVMEHAQQQAGQVELDVDAMRAMLGLDQPIYIQYGDWMSDVVRGNLGESLWTGRALKDMLVERLPVTFELGILAFLIAQLIAFPVGIYSAMRQDTAGDYLGRSAAIMGLSAPGFWLATMVMVFPAIWWGWSPPVCYIPFLDDPITNLQQFIIPAVLLGAAMSAITMRMLRTTLLEVLRQDYIRTAWSKGLKERVVVMRHALKNSLIPVVTIVSGQIPIMIGGTVIFEQIFSLPGIGRLFFDAIVTRDYTIVSGLNLVLAGVGLFIILATDLSYAYLDPRVRYE